MRLPRDVSAEDLCRRLAPFGYVITRQTGSHLRLTTQTKGEHHLTIPKHSRLRVGTLSAILKDVGSHFELTRQQLIARLFG